MARVRGAMRIACLSKLSCINVGQVKLIMGGGKRRHRQRAQGKFSNVHLEVNLCGFRPLVPQHSADHRHGYVILQHV